MIRQNSNATDPEDFSLDSVIAIYNRDYNGTIAIQHKVLEGNRYGPGKIVTREMQKRLLQAISPGGASLAFLPDNVLGYNPSAHAIAWWVPERVRSCRFVFDRNVSGSDIGTVVKHVQPPHLFIIGGPSGRLFRAYALPANKRPSQDTKLLVSPYWNLYDNGSLCVGTTDFREPTPENIKWNTEAFFSSVFTHPNSKSSAHPKSDYALWQEILAYPKLKPIPAEYFLPANLTVQEALGGKSGR